jgi:hypothetical protein
MQAGIQVGSGLSSIMTGIIIVVFGGYLMIKGIKQIKQGLSNSKKSE